MLRLLYVARNQTNALICRTGRNEQKPMTSLVCSCHMTSSGYAHRRHGVVERCHRNLITQQIPTHTQWFIVCPYETVNICFHPSIYHNTNICNLRNHSHHITAVCKCTTAGQTHNWPFCTDSPSVWQQRCRQTSDGWAVTAAPACAQPAGRLLTATLGRRRLSAQQRHG